VRILIEVLAQQGNRIKIIRKLQRSGY